MLDNQLTQAVEDIAVAFERRSVRYALIGGLAVSVRGQMRSTQDADFIVNSPALAFPGLLEDLVAAGFEIDVMHLIRNWPIEKFTVFYRGEVRIDWMQPILPLYARVLADATPTSWGQGKSIVMATPEGLILTKLVAFRPRDQLDIETLFRINCETINPTTIREEWQILAGNFPDRTTWLEERLAKYLPTQ